MNVQIGVRPAFGHLRMVATCCMVFGNCLLAEAVTWPVVMTGDAAPGSGGRSFTDRFTDPLLNNLGEIAFGASVGGSADEGVWYTAGGLVVQPALAIEGGVAPGGSYASLQTNSIRFNDAGHAGYRVSVAGNDGYWSNRTGSVALIVQEGDPAPGSLPPSNFSNLNSARFYLNNSSHIAFNDSNLDGVWSESSGSLQLVAGAGNDGPGGISIRNVPALEYNNNGHSVMRVDDSSANNYLLTDRGGTLQKVVGAGDAAPGGGAFPIGGNPIGAVRFNNNSQIAFEADVEELIGGVVTLRHGIFVEDAGGTLRVVGKEGVSLPDGTVPGSATAIQVLALDDQGMLFYHAGADPSLRNLYVYDTNTNTNSLLIAGGAPAPGTTSTFTSFNSSVKTNAGGQLAFRARLADGNDGFWIEQTLGAGDYRPIVYEGQVFEVAPGDFRTVDAIDLNPTQFFNDQGYCAYQVAFSDGTEAIFAVPESSTFALAAIGLLTLALCRWRRRR